MRAALAIVPLVFAINCLAVPAWTPPQEILRQGDCVSNITDSFRLAWENGAYGFPLATGTADASSKTAILSQWRVQFPITEFLLRDGIILAFGNGFRGISIGAEVGVEFTFIAATKSELNDSVRPPRRLPHYCAQSRTLGAPILAVEGDTRSFSLCPAWDGHETPVIVYKAGPSGSYDYPRCIPVYLPLNLDI